MSTAAQRNEKINKLYKVVKKHYQPIMPPSNRTVIEHMLYSCCLEDSTYELADEVFARLQEEYFDWNEVRVTTINELAEVMKRLPKADEAANRIRRTLHGLFEAHYTFDLEFLKKENLGKAIEQLGKYKGMSPFCIAYTTQVAFAGHSIPIDQSFIDVALVIDIVSEADAASMKVTGLERTIPKNKGVEFASLVHQMAVSYSSSPFNKDIRAIILEIDKEAADRFPKRGGKKKPDVVEPSKSTKKASKSKTEKVAEEPKAAAKAAPKKAATKPVKKVEKKVAKKVPAKPAKKAPAKKAAVKKAVRRKPR
ncbi:MAG: hypothetical protein R3C03_07535 [Pirellulaceae bacterium]